MVSFLGFKFLNAPQKNLIATGRFAIADVRLLDPTDVLVPRLQWIIAFVIFYAQFVCPTEFVN